MKVSIDGFDFEGSVDEFQAVLEILATDFDVDGNHVRDPSPCEKCGWRDALSRTEDDIPVCDECLYDLRYGDCTYDECNCPDEDELYPCGAEALEDKDICDDEPCACHAEAEDGDGDCGEAHTQFVDSGDSFQAPDLSKWTFGFHTDVPPVCTGLGFVPSTDNVVTSSICSQHYYVYDKDTGGFECSDCSAVI